LLLPGEDNNDDYMSYETGDEIKAIEWEKEKFYDDFMKLYHKNGNLRMTINNEEFGFSRESNNQFEWHITLSGDESGYSQFNISSDIAFQDYSMALEYLFGDKEFNGELVKECEGYGINGFKIYEIKMP